ncbi:hypothetical protein C8J56DRAFT_332214 [Mycena floridula]|nr:hypothetical protein C8J56DRAFT_332214 [Mycena floridula]
MVLTSYTTTTELVPNSLTTFSVRPAAGPTLLEQDIMQLIVVEGDNVRISSPDEKPLGSGTHTVEPIVSDPSLPPFEPMMPPELENLIIDQVYAACDKASLSALSLSCSRCRHSVISYRFRRVFLDQGFLCLMENQFSRTSILDRVKEVCVKTWPVNHHSSPWRFPNLTSLSLTDLTWTPELSSIFLDENGKSTVESLCLENVTFPLADSTLCAFLKERFVEKKSFSTVSSSPLEIGTARRYFEEEVPGFEGMLSLSLHASPSGLKKALTWSTPPGACAGGETSLGPRLKELEIGCGRSSLLPSLRLWANLFNQWR